MSTEHHDFMNEIEAALASLAPTASQTASPAGRDRLMYEAGRAAAEAHFSRARRPRAWLWPASTAAMALLALSLGAMLVHERSAKSASDGPPMALPAKRPPIETEEKLPQVAPPQIDGAARIAADDASREIAPLASYVLLRRRVLEEGVEALPDVRGFGGPSPSEPLTPRSSLEFLQ